MSLITFGDFDFSMERGGRGAKHSASYLEGLVDLFLQKGLEEKFLGSRGHLSPLSAQAFPLGRVGPFHSNLNVEDSISTVSSPCLFPWSGCDWEAAGSAETNLSFNGDPNGCMFPR